MPTKFVLKAHFCCFEKYRIAPQKKGPKVPLLFCLAAATLILQHWGAGGAPVP